MPGNRRKVRIVHIAQPQDLSKPMKIKVECTLCALDAFSNLQKLHRWTQSAGVYRCTLVHVAVHVGFQKNLRKLLEPKTRVNVVHVVHVVKCSMLLK